MGFRWLEGVKLWSAAAVAGIQHQQHRSKRVKIIETVHQQQVDETAEYQDPEGELERKIDLMCKESLNKYFLGAGFAVAVSVNGKMKYRKAFGVKDFENFVPAEEVEDFKVPIYSVSKPITAFCWMKYMDDNNLDWESHDIYSVVSDLPRTGYLDIYNQRCGVMDFYKMRIDRTLNEDEEYEAVGAKHILTHIAGFDRQAPNEDDFKTYHSANHWFNTYKGFYQVLADQPGVSYSYSNMGYNLMGVMLERLHHNTYKNYCMELMTDLGMKNTTFGTSGDVLMEEIIPGLGHFPEDSSIMMTRGMGHNFDFREGASGLVSDVDDLDRFGNITAHMYQRAYLQYPQYQDLTEKLPLSRKKIKMQHDALRALNMESGEHFSQSVGWEVYREMQSMKADRRRIKLRLGHSGLGFGSTAAISISFHQLDVDRSEGNNDYSLARQLLPSMFEYGTIEPSLRKQPLRSQCLTPWEIPPEMMVRDIDKIREYAEKRLPNDVARLKNEIDSFLWNATILLYLMNAPPDPEVHDSHFYHRRLQRLLEKLEEWVEEKKKFYDRLERKIFRQLIREHNRLCRSDKDPETDVPFASSLESANIFRDEYKRPLLDALEENLGNAIDEIKEEMNELADQIRGVPGVTWEDSDGICQDPNIQRKASVYDVTQPFNVNPDAWPGMQGSLLNDDQDSDDDESDRFAEIELGRAESCRCRLDWNSMSLQYASCIEDVHDAPNDDRREGGEDMDKKDIDKVQNIQDIDKKDIDKVQDTQDFDKVEDIQDIDKVQNINDIRDIQEIRYNRDDDTDDNRVGSEDIQDMGNDDDDDDEEDEYFTVSDEEEDSDSEEEYETCDDGTVESRSNDENEEENEENDIEGWENDEESCENDEESCENDEESCENDEGSCENDEESFENDEGSCENDEESCENDEGSCENDEESCENDEGSYENDEGSCENDEEEDYDSEEEDETYDDGSEESCSDPEYEIVDGVMMYLVLDMDRRGDSSYEVLEEKSSQVDEMAAPDSWFDPEEGNGVLRHYRRWRKREDKLRSVVVSIVCNQRFYEPRELGRKIDDAFAQHYFPLDDDDVSSDVGPPSNGNQGRGPSGR